MIEFQILCKNTGINLTTNKNAKVTVRDVEKI